MPDGDGVLPKNAALNLLCSEKADKTEDSRESNLLIFKYSLELLYILQKSTRPVSIIEWKQIHWCRTLKDVKISSRMLHFIATIFIFLSLRKLISPAAYLMDYDNETKRKYIYR